MIQSSGKSSGMKSFSALTKNFRKKRSETQTDFTAWPRKIIFFSRMDLPEKEPDKVEEKDADKVDTPVASSSQAGGIPLYPALDEEMLEQF